VKPPPFTYHRPDTVEEAVQMLAELGRDDGGPGGGAKVLAGGQSLVPLMSMRLSAPGHLVDLNHVAGLDTVEATPEEVRVGALARHARVERDELAHAAAPLLRQALAHVAHPAIRNRGTVVGSIVHADPSAEMPAVLTLLDGEVELVGSGGRRSVGAGDFFVGPMESAVRADEVAVAARFRWPAGRAGSAFVELARRSGDYAMCGVAALVTAEGDGTLTSARVALISVGPGPVLVDLSPTVSASGGELDRDGVRDLVDQAVDPEDDIHASAGYRRRLAGVLTERALDEARGRAA
jgi:carbon-monoxide dehydrogenase medium subunit